MSNKLYVARIVYSTSTDGVGLRNSLYLSGCNIHCSGCHNKELWDIKSGIEMDIEDIYTQLNQDDFNISILGGEPLMQYNGVVKLCQMIKERTKKNIWLWTGYTIDYVALHCRDILKYVDYIVDGPYIDKLKDTSLRFRGSKNQRIYKINKGENSISFKCIE